LVHQNFYLPAEDGIRCRNVTGVQTCALPIYTRGVQALLQQQNLLIAFDASELLRCFEESGGCRSAAADFLLASCFSIDALALRYLGSGSSASDFLDRQQVANRRFEG